MAVATAPKEKQWYEKISRSGYFFGAVLLHLIVLILVASYVVFPPIHTATDDFTKAYLQHSPSPAPLPPPSTPQPTVDLASRATATPVPQIVVPGGTQSFTPPVLDITPATTGVALRHNPSPNVALKPRGISPERLIEIKKFVKTYRTDDPLASDNDPRNIKTATFPVYLASYADGDWYCNVHMTDGKIDAGSLPNLIAKVGEWSHGNITAEVEPTPLNIGGPDLLKKKPPFIFFTGHKDFQLTPREVENLSAYLEMGGFILGDNALAGRGSRFDVAFRREMKRVVPDLDKNFEPVAVTDDLFTKWFQISKVPQGINYYAEPLEHLDIDGQVAILYMPNDYSDMFTMRILPGDTQIVGDRPDKKSQSPLFTTGIFLNNRNVFFRNFQLPGSLEAQHLGMNIIGYILVRFDKDLLLATP